MILCLSSSSPNASLAIYSDDFRLQWNQSAVTNRNAAYHLLGWVDESFAKLGLEWADFSGFIADIGPGSFTGTRVAIMLVKAYAVAHGKPCAGVTSFDLVSPSAPVAIAYKKNELFLRHLDGTVEILDRSAPIPPNTEMGSSVVDFAARIRPDMTINWLSPEALLPFYGAEPSVSTPKRSPALR